MKRMFFAAAALALLPLGLFAAGLPNSIWLKGGNVSVRLEGVKRYTMNRIEWCGKYMCIDTPCSHYGMVFYFKDRKGFVGSGHREARLLENIAKLVITCDGREVTPVEGQAIEGKVVTVEKISTFRYYTARSVITICDNHVDEYAEVTSDAERKCDGFYLFMHPWSTRFLKLDLFLPGNVEKPLEFYSSDKFFIDGAPCETAAFFDPHNGDAVVTSYRALENGVNVGRRVWDRDCYRKDYCVDYEGAVFPAGKTAVYAARTEFFQLPLDGDWKGEARTRAAKFTWEKP